MRHALQLCEECKDLCNQITKELSELKNAREKAWLADDVYERAEGGPNTPMPPELSSWKRLSDDPDAIRKLLGHDGMTDQNIKELFEPEGSSFRAVLYEKDDGELTLSFRGTKTGEDWKENAIQGVGKESAHYEKAKSLGQFIKLLAQRNGRDFNITGHSKGGGMAAAAAVWTSTPAVTFNPAGLHQNTVKGKDLRSGKTLVTDFIVDGEILNHKVQDNREHIIKGINTGAGAVGKAGGKVGGGAVGSAVAGPGGTAVGQQVGGKVGKKLAHDWAEEKTKDIIPLNAGRRVDLPYKYTKPPDHLNFWQKGKHKAAQKLGITQHAMESVHNGIELKTAQLKAKFQELGCDTVWGVDGPSRNGPMFRAFA